MAKPTAKNMNLNEAIFSFSNRNIRPVYLLIGNDQFLQDFFIKKLESHIFVEEAVNKNILLVDDIGSKDVINKLNEADLFSSKKLFILRNPNSLRGKTRDELLDYCLKPNLSHYLVIIHEDFSLKNKFLKSLSSSLGVISVSTPFENEMNKWVRLFLDENGVTSVSQEITKKIIEAYGDSLFNLKNEIDKLCLNLGTDNEITANNVSEFLSSSRGYKKYQLFNSLGMRETFLSIKLGRSLVSKNSSMLELLKPMNEFYQEMLYLKIFRGTNQVKKSFTLLSPSIVRQLPQFAKNYSGKEIVSALKRLGKIDKQLKNSQIDDESAITEFIYATTTDG